MPTAKLPDAPRVTLKQAQGAAIAAQGLAASSALHSVDQVLNTLGAVQLDTISTLARSHELVAHARIDGLDRAIIEASLWGDPPHTFEYWSHAACILPSEMMPYFAFRRRYFRRRGARWHDVPSRATLNAIRRRLADGPATATQLGGARRGGAWWDWSEAKVGVEWLLDIGEVVCTQRVGWRRVYSLRATDEQHSGWVMRDGVYGPSDEECIQALVSRSLRTLGVGSLSDVIDVHRLAGQGSSTKIVTAALARLVSDGDAVPVSVTGWTEPAYMWSGFTPRAERGRTTLLSPFDSLVWHRDRVSRLFGMDYRLEAYTPAARRVYGYFAMPVLHGSSLIARVDPTKTDRGRVMHAARVTMQPSHSAADVTAVGTALIRAAGWIGATAVTVGDVVPASAARVLRKAVS